MQDSKQDPDQKPTEQQDPDPEKSFRFHNTEHCDFRKRQNVNSCQAESARGSDKNNQPTTAVRRRTGIRTPRRFQNENEKKGAERITGIKINNENFQGISLTISLRERMDFDNFVVIVFWE